MNSGQQISAAFMQLHPEEATRVLERLDPIEVADFLTQTPSSQAASVLRCATASNAARWLESCDATEAARLLKALPLDLASILLRALDPSKCSDVLESLPKAVAEPLHLLLGFPETSAGALLDPRVLAIAEDAAIGEAIEEIRCSPHTVIYYLYVVDRDRKLVGVINLRELLLAPPEDGLSRWMHRNVVSLNAQDDQSMFASHAGWRLFHALPVVEERGVFLGAIRHETLWRVRERLAEGEPVTGLSTAGKALGELYWLGLTGVLQALGSTLSPGEDS